MPKFVQIDGYVEFPTGTDRSDQFSSLNLEAMRAEVEASVYGDRVDKVAPGTFKNTTAMVVRPDADWVFMRVLIAALNADVNVSMTYRPDSSAKSTSNPEFVFPVCVSKIPSLGGQRGALMEGSYTLQINGSIEYDDGTTQISIGG